MVWLFSLFNYDGSFFCLKVFNLIFSGSLEYLVNLRLCHYWNRLINVSTPPGQTSVPMSIIKKNNIPAILIASIIFSFNLSITVT